VQVVVQRVEVAARVLLGVPVKVEAELLARLHRLFLLTVATLSSCEHARVRARARVCVCVGGGACVCLEEGVRVGMCMCASVGAAVPVA
jgi:hypothetical protein